MKGFKAFLMRGNVVELAVAVVVGAAFGKIVDAFVKGIINPVIGTVGTQNLDIYVWCVSDPCKVNGGQVTKGIGIAYGSVLGAAVTFVITAAVVYFGLILPMNKVNERRQGGKESASAKETELDLLIEIRDLLARQSGDGPGSARGQGHTAAIPTQTDRGAGT